VSTSCKLLCLPYVLSSSVHLFFEMLPVLVFWLISFNCRIFCHFFFFVFLCWCSRTWLVPGLWFRFYLLLPQNDLVLAITAHTHTIPDSSALFFFFCHGNQCAPLELRLEIIGQSWQTDFIKNIYNFEYIYNSLPAA